MFEIKFAFSWIDPPVFVDFDFEHWSNEGDSQNETVEEFSFVVDGSSI